ncbi:hypothetical protein VZC37_14755 [Gordonia sp. LSe1-13]|uniref:Uncharacterized protein n=1 Tax=Gordonia sesuvii TaxID=3116777 RepID=A0ABU7MEZ7_9ACTN|nr:hypothetical protein [Gordonia sp. LSe1-13]
MTALMLLALLILVLSPIAIRIQRPASRPADLLHPRFDRATGAQQLHDDVVLHHLQHRDSA